MDKNIPSPIGGEGIFIFPSARAIQRGTPERRQRSGKSRRQQLDQKYGIIFAKRL